MNAPANTPTPDSVALRAELRAPKGGKFLVLMRALNRYSDDGDYAHVWNSALDAALASLPTPGVPVERVRYRLIEEGEVILADDEFIDDDGETWVRGPRWSVGMAYPSRVMKSCRRRLDALAQEGTSNG